eukprot:SAG11_NODE_7971_length_1075_cov_1.500000_1_plen_135_part_00
MCAFVLWQALAGLPLGSQLVAVGGVAVDTGADVEAALAIVAGEDEEVELTLLLPRPSRGGAAQKVSNGGGEGAVGEVRVGELERELDVLRRRLAKAHRDSTRGSERASRNTSEEVLYYQRARLPTPWLYDVIPL